MSKEIIYSDAAREKMKAGIDKVADAVKVTLGPRGRNVIIKKNWGNPVVTKDGVTVAREISLKDHFEDVGAQLCKQVASKANDVAGDGTTTATILAQALVAEGMKYISQGGNAIAVKRGIDKAVEQVVEFLTKETTEIKLSDRQMVEYVATISGNDPEVGKTVADAFIGVGGNGVVTFEETKMTKTSLEIVKGLHFDRGYASPYFCTDTIKMKAELANPVILFWEKRITNPQELLPLLNTVAAAKKPLVIISDGVEGDALGMLLINKLNGTLDVVAVNAPGFGERRKSLMNDMAIATGGKFFDEAVGHKLETISITSLGKAQKVIVSANDTTIVGGEGEKIQIEDLVTSLKEQITISESKYDAEKLTERLAKLSGGVGIIKLGAYNETEMGEKKFRYEDAISATKAALEMGIVAGGGVPLFAAAAILKRIEGNDEDEQAGIEIVRKALSAPLKTIAANAGYSSEVVAEKVAASEWGKVGFDAKTGQYVDMVKMGIIDPVKVVKSAIENAASIAGLFLTTEGMIVDSPDEEKPQANPYAQYM